MNYDDSITLDKLLETMVELDGSDLHLAYNTNALIRVHGEFVKVNMPLLNDEMLEQLLLTILSDSSN